MKKILEMCRRIDEINDKKGEIFIRCAGQEGKQTYYELKQSGVRVTAFLDHNVEAKGLEVPVYSPEILLEKKRGEFFVIIAVRSDDVYECIEKEMKGYGLRKGADYGSFGAEHRMAYFTDICPVESLEIKYAEVCRKRSEEGQEFFSGSLREMNGNENLIPSLDVVLTTYCSLSCTYCSHCIPDARPPKHYNNNEVIATLEKLLSVSCVECIGIMGGEPMVYPELAEFLEKYRRLRYGENIGFTRIVTNGTVIPKNEVFEIYRTIPNSYIYISNYGKKSSKLEVLRDKCREFEIPVYTCSYNNVWLDLGETGRKRNYSSEEVRHLYNICESNSCMQLINGRLYTCGRAPVLNEYGVIPYSETDYCMILEGDDSTLKERIHSFLYEKEFLNACYYCDGQHKYSRRVERGE